MIELDKIKSLISKDYSLTEQQEYYFLRRVDNGEVIEFYKKRVYSDNEDLLNKINNAISNHKKMHFGRRLKSFNEPSGEETSRNLSQKLKQKGLFVVE